MTLEQLLEFLKKQADGEKYSTFIQELINGKDTSNIKLTEDLKTAKANLKTAQGDTEKYKKKAEILLDALGIDEEDDDVAGAVEKLTNAKSNDEVLQRKVAKLEKKLTDDTKELTDKLNGERAKRFNAMAKSELMKVLTENNVMNPEELHVLFRDKITVNEDDESITFTGDDRKETTLSEGIKAWSSKNKQFVKNSSVPGAGSNAGGAGGGDEVLSFAKSLAANNKPSTASDDILKHYE